MVPKQPTFPQIQLKILTAADLLDDIINNAINSIRKNKKRPDESSIYEFLNKDHANANLTKITINQGITFRSNNNHITNTLNNEKNSYFETNIESYEPKQNTENQILTDTETPTPKKVQLQIYRISWKNKQNLFILKLSGVRAEIKNVTFSEIPDLTENRVSIETDLFEKQINFLKEC